MLFRADTKVLEEIDGVIFDGAVIERADGDNRNLRAGFLLELSAKRFEALTCGGGNYACEIGYVALGNDFGDVVRGSKRSEEEKEQREEKRPRNSKLGRRAQKNSQVFGLRNDTTSGR